VCDSGNGPAGATFPASTNVHRIASYFTCMHACMSMELLFPHIEYAVEHARRDGSTQTDRGKDEIVLVGSEHFGRVRMVARRRSPVAQCVRPLGFGKILQG
jgi:hypothetical protein